MPDQSLNPVFLSYKEANLDFVESLACRLQGDTRLSFWFGPRPSTLGASFQVQAEGMP